MDAVRDLMWKIHRGEKEATMEERSAIDALLTKTDTVSPWIAERTLRAASQEPELLAVIPGKRAVVSLEDTPSGEPEVRSGSQLGSAASALWTPSASKQAHRMRRPAVGRCCVPLEAPVKEQINKLKEQRFGLVDEMRDLVTLAESEERDLSGEEAEKFAAREGR
jgi:hypothetical protein